jgi:hypothetical protein
MRPAVEFQRVTRVLRVFARQAIGERIDRRPPFRAPSLLFGTVAGHFDAYRPTDTKRESNARHGLWADRTATISSVI